MKFKVIRQHYGDRMYVPGDERDLSEADAATLVRNGVLRKMAEKPANKAEPKAANKAEPSAKSKGA